MISLISAAVIWDAENPHSVSIVWVHRIAFHNKSSEYNSTCVCLWRCTSISYFSNDRYPSVRQIELCAFILASSITFCHFLLSSDPTKILHSLSTTAFALGICRKDVLHDEGQLSPVNPKNFFQVALVDRVLHFHFSTLKKTERNHILESNLILTFQRVSPCCRQEQVVQVDDVHTKSSPGLYTLKKTRSKPFLRSSSS